MEKMTKEGQNSVLNLWPSCAYVGYHHGFEQAISLYENYVAVEATRPSPGP
jgi:hypothetical protein